MQFQALFKVNGNFESKTGATLELRTLDNGRHFVSPILKEGGNDLAGVEVSNCLLTDVDTTISLTFMLGGMLAGAAGLIYALYETTIWYFQGFEAGLIAFTAAVMGGIGNLRGAVLGGLIIGCIQNISDARIGPQWTPAIVFGYLVMIMVLRPRGLLGEETREAG